MNQLGNSKDDFKKKVAISKFKDMPFAKKQKGHIVLQDHGQGVAFRNVKIKSVSPGEYTAPPAQGPRTIESCGTTPE